MDVKIKKIYAREILDSRGFPTVETDVYLSDGSFGRSAVPSGASTGSNEALELRDGDKRYHGKGVLKAVNNVNNIIAKSLVGIKAIEQQKIDKMMIDLDGTLNKSKLGANAILSVSMALMRAAAVANHMPLYAYIRKVYGIKEKDYYIPTPMLNIVNGGKHADSGLSVQEFMIVPVGANSFAGAIRMASEVYHTLKGILSSKGYTISVGDEGGFAPKVFTHESVLEIIVDSIVKSGYTTKDIKIAIDSAASEFYKDGKYIFEGTTMTSKELISKYEEWRKYFPVVSFEDPLAEYDWDGWQSMTKSMGKKVRLVGDDIFVTNPTIFEKGITEDVANAILIKLNQIGTLSETIDVINMAKKSGYATIISHRSGETEDNFIADLAVATNACAIKTGAPARSERLSKYNQLIRIEEELAKKSRYAGDMAFRLK
ncbi:MAG: phosphopyruvate hydratase [Elusimicrobiales bacterium]|nr:phosphopyruvate hydratase [Elusimicrobiales bacterium]NLH38590.1 phosphopyruvate hydratase [Elusimicrobiota bacterium]